MPTLSRLERCLLPPPEIIRWNNGNLIIEKSSSAEKMWHCTKNFFQFTAILIIAPFAAPAAWLWDRCCRKTLPTAQRKTPDITPAQIVWPPTQRGFATSLFQTSGLGTKWTATPDLAGKCDWDRWMDKPGHVDSPKGFDKKDFFVEILKNPSAYIQMLQSQNVTAHRVSLEWAVFQPKRGETDPKAVELYRNFFQKLLEAGITPTVTLSHFVLPEWFYESGGFQKMENIDVYVDFALKAMECFPEIKDWWSFNELGVKAFQQAREVYPTDVPEGSWLPTRVHAAGIATRNMLIAHCKLHRAVAQLHPDKKIGVTHQWLQFDTASGNWLERLISYLFTKFAFTPVYQFFKEGRYSFEFPFMANIQFEVPKDEFEKNGRFLMRLGVQAYPKAMLKMGLNHGQTYPGSPSIKNLPFFSFGASCEPGGAVMSFGPRWKAERMDQILDEAFALTNQVHITEYGSDAKLHKWGKPGFELDDQGQACYLQQLTERIRNYSAKTFRQIQGIFCWSDLRRQMEWEKGHECKLGIIEPIVDDQRRMVGWNSTPASRYLAGVYANPIHQDEKMLGDKVS